MQVRFLKVAQYELDESVDYYNDEVPGLGLKFLAEVLKSIDLIVTHPEAWPEMSVRTRRCQLNRFPFGLIFQIRSDEILIIAVAHLHRKPGYWMDRGNSDI